MPPGEYTDLLSPICKHRILRTNSNSTKQHLATRVTERSSYRPILIREGQFIITCWVMNARMWRRQGRRCPRAIGGHWAVTHCQVRYRPMAHLPAGRAVLPGDAACDTLWATGVRFDHQTADGGAVFELHNANCVLSRLHAWRPATAFSSKV